MLNQEILSDYRLAYCLPADTREIQLVQQASLSPDPRIGLKHEFGLFGTAAWWSAIENGTIQTAWSSGRIIEVVTEDYPLVRYHDGDHECKITLKGRDDAFAPGRGIIVFYAVQEFKQQLPGGPPTDEVTLAIWVSRDATP